MKQERLLQEVTEKLRAAFGERVVSVVLYGSAAAGEHHEQYSDLNILCVLTRVTAEEMRAAEKIFRWWRKQGNPSPLLLSEAEVARSTDCFAIEFRDIRECHRILAGRDVISGLEIGDSNYRAQVEHELRAKFLRLRQKAAGVFSNKELLRGLMVDSVTTFCVLFRHALAIRGIAVGLRKREIVAAAQAAFGIEPGPFLTLLEIREGRIKAHEVDPEALLPAYLEGIGAVIHATDWTER